MTKYDAFMKEAVAGGPEYLARLFTEIVIESVSTLSAIYGVPFTEEEKLREATHKKYLDYLLAEHKE